MNWFKMDETITCLALDVFLKFYSSTFTKIKLVHWFWCVCVFYNKSICFNSCSLHLSIIFSSAFQKSKLLLVTHFKEILGGFFVDPAHFTNIIVQFVPLTYERFFTAAAQIMKQVRWTQLYVGTHQWTFLGSAQLSCSEVKRGA